MAFFKLRWPGQGSSAEKTAKRPRSPQAESIEVMRRRARHRLMGAAVLVLLGVVGFPILFDTQPRPIPVDVPIEIPDRNKAAPLVALANAGDPDETKATASERLSASATLADGEELVSANGGSRALAKASSGSAVTAASGVSVKPPYTKKPSTAVPKAPARAEEVAANKHPSDARKPVAPDRSDDERFIVQVGAFADADKAKEVRVKLERAGLKTYTQVVDSKDGKRTRVRVGPYSSRAEADKAAARIKGLDLSASILTL